MTVHKLRTYSMNDISISLLDRLSEKLGKSKSQTVELGLNTLAGVLNLGTEEVMKEH